MIITRKIKNRLKRLHLYYKNKDVLAKNKKLKNTKTGKRCFILGTGPSIKDQDILKLKNEETFVVNAFWNYPQYTELNPKYYVIMDRNVFSKTNDRNYWKEQFFSHVSLLSKLSTRFLFHIDAKEIVENNNLFPSERMNYIVSSGFFKENLNFNTDISRVIPNTKNVIVACLVMAAYMGFEEIFLLGCEHNFLAKPQHHDLADFFYEPKKFDENNPEEVKYYDPGFTPTYEGFIHNVKILFQNYRLLKARLAIEKPKVKIYNATPNSFLDVFPFVKYEDIK